MSAMMRAKMMVTNVVANPTTPLQEVTMVPVCGNKPFGPNGESEDNTFATWTPTGELRLTITNPALHGKLQQGQKFYVDFTETD